MSESKRIIKNTLFLYIRMFLVMGVSLYTSRIVLDVLGVSDYGIYNLVGGLVAMLGFFNAAMTSATQRYLSYDIGKNDLIQLKITFSTTLSIHLAIATLVLVLSETLGLWYVNYKMIYPTDRTFAVNVVYQFSILTFLLGIIQVPYNALIIAKEKMNIFSYISILEVSLKLGTVFLLLFFGSDKLIIYAFLIFIVALIIRIIYQIYCRKNFEESKFSLTYDKVYFNELLSYSGWNLFGNFAAVARGQGLNMMLNLFLGTIVNAAYGITIQVQSAVQMFVHNFQIALNPQIIQSYAAGNKQKSIQLMLQGSKFSFFLMWIVILPLLFNTEYIISLWLNTPPEYSISFIQLTLITVLIDSISGPLMTIITATGKIKFYHLVIGSTNLLILPISYLLLSNNNPPTIVFTMGIVFSFISLFFRLLFVKKDLNIKISSFINAVFLRIFFVTLISMIILIPLNYYFSDISKFSYFLFEVFITCFLSIVIIYLIGLNKDEKKYIYKLIRRKQV